MNNDSRLVYMSTTPTARGAFTGEVSRIGTEARIGYVNADERSRRVVLYLSDAIHYDTRDETVELDTWFIHDEERGSLAVCGEAGEIACSVVGVLSNFTWTPYDSFRGIWLSKSDNPEYAAKLTFRLSYYHDFYQLLRAVAWRVFGEGTPFTSQICTEDRMSEGEARAHTAYNALDFDYDY